MLLSMLLSHLFVTSNFDIHKQNTNSIQNKNKCFTKNYWVSLEVSWLHTSFVYQSKSSTRNLNKQINQIWITRVFHKCNKYQGQNIELLGIAEGQFLYKR